MGEGEPAQRLVAVTIDEGSLGASTAEAEHEREIAIYDLLAENSFALDGQERGPYRLRLAMVQGRLVLDIADAEDRQVIVHVLSLTRLRPVVSEYRTICERHYAAIRSASPSQIEAIDMGRRGLHNDAATLLTERLRGKVTMDFATARRLFTLLVALHWDA